MSAYSDSFFSDHPLFVLDHTTLDVWDVNDQAIDFYGYSRDEFCQMNINDLGEKKRRIDLISPLAAYDESADKIWRHYTKKGEAHYVQFTSHLFNYKGNPARLAVAHNVTEQVKSQEQNPNKFPQMQQYRGDRPLAEIIWDKDKKVKKWSEKAEDIFGWSEEEVVGKPDFFETFIYEGEHEKALKIIDDAANSLTAVYTVEGKVRTKSGEVRACEWYNTLVYDKYDNLASMNSLVQDISDRKESEQLFRALSEESLVGVYLIQDDIFKYINPRFAQIFGYKKYEIEGVLGPLDLTHPDDRAEVSENLKKRLDENVGSLHYDFRCLTRNRDTIHVQVFGTRIEYLGKPAVVGTLLDITHSKLAFKRYQASLESFEDLFDSISDAIYIQDKKGRFIKVNNAAVELNGFDRDFLLGKTPDFLAAPQKTDLKQTHNYFRQALNGDPQHFEQWGKRKNGEIFPEEVILNPGTYFGENVVIAITRDITNEYEVQDEIKKSREKFSQLFKNVPFGIVMMDKHQEIRMVNKAFEDIFGFKEADIEGLNVDNLIVPKGKEESAHQFSREIFLGKTGSATTTRRSKEGSLVDVLIYGVPVTVNDQTIAIFGIYVDITERKIAEEKIRKSLKEKEVLLAEIHHRVKNNLAVITGLLELQQYNTDVQEAKDILRESQLRINSIALIHEKLYQNENLSQISIDIYLRELADIIISSMATERTDVSISIDSSSIFLTINEAIPCGLILNELITNSYKHAFQDRKTGQISINLEKKGNEIKLMYRDDGMGLPEDLDVENPDSLGLTLIRTLSKQLRGVFSLQSDTKGMSFRLTFKLDN